MRKLDCLLIVALIAGAFASRCPAATVRVPEDQKTIADAIAAAGSGDTVSVAPGEYVITKPVSFLGKPITLESRGGAADTTIRMAESPLDPHRTSVVVFESGETKDSVLRGFTISGGGGTGEYSSGYGVECGRFEDRPWASGPTLEGCEIRDNMSGMACTMASPRLIGCTIAGNRQAALTFSGGTSVELTDCTITGNPWGKLELTKCTATLSGCVVSSNGAGISGSGSKLTLKDCTIAGNSSATSWPEPSATLEPISVGAPSPGNPR